MKHTKAFFLIIIVLSVVVTADDAFACSCVPEANPFLKVAPKSVLVIRARVLRHTGGGETPREMEVEVLESLAGETPKSVVTISGDDGGQCRPYVSRFAVGTEWILALEPAITDTEAARHYFMSEPDKGDYAISNCGAYWLEVKKGKVRGNIDIEDYERRHEHQEIPLEELRRRFAAAKKSAHSLTPASNNGMHPTANSAALIRETWPYRCCVRGG